jgi:hypothetical protein
MTAERQIAATTAATHHRQTPAVRYGAVRGDSKPIAAQIPPSQILPPHRTVRPGTPPVRPRTPRDARSTPKYHAQQPGRLPLSRARERGAGGEGPGL